MWKAIRNNIFVGLTLVTPLVITAFVVNWLFRFTTNQFVTLYPEAVRDTNLEIVFRILSLIVVVFILFLIGVFVRNIIGRRIYQLGDKLLTRIPFISRIYLASRQVIDAFVTQRETVFNQAVLVQYPRKGVFSVGFQTATAPVSFRKHIPEGKPDEKYVAVFIPTTPNPTSGWLVYVPQDDVTPLPHNSGDMMKCIISAGVVYPDEIDMPPPESLVDKLHKIFRKDSGKDKIMEPETPEEIQTADETPDSPAKPDDVPPD